MGGAANCVYGGANLFSVVLDRYMRDVIQDKK